MKIYAIHFLLANSFVHSLTQQQMVLIKSKQMKNFSTQPSPPDAKLAVFSIKCASERENERMNKLINTLQTSS